MKHKYSSLITLDAAAGLVANHVYSANGMFDPNISGAGHQPLGYDQMATLFQDYTVIGVKFTAKFTNYGGASNGTLHTYVVGIYPSIDNGGSTNPHVCLESRGAVWTTIRDTSPSATLVKKLSPATYLGFKKSDAMAEVDLKGGTGNNPLKEVYFNVWYMATNDSVSKYYLSHIFEPAGQPRHRKPHSMNTRLCQVIVVVVYVDPVSMDVVIMIEYLAIWQNPRNPGLS